MKAVILSAGQGRRMLPMTAERPKCLLPVAGLPLIQWQIQVLAGCGIDEITVVVGFGAEKVERVLAVDPPLTVRTVYNPFFQVADNLASCWIAREQMQGDFVLLNGDTLFETRVLQRLLDSPSAPVAGVIDRKRHYDADDMKVQIDGTRLIKIGKNLPARDVHGESIGLFMFRDDGPMHFRAAVEGLMRNPDALQLWFLSAIEMMASVGQANVVPIGGLDWTEVDFPADLNKATRMVSGWGAQRENILARSAG